MSAADADFFLPLFTVSLRLSKPQQTQQILFMPLPVELNDNNEAVEALYEHAMGKAGIHATWI